MFIKLETMEKKQKDLSVVLDLKNRNVDYVKLDWAAQSIGKQVRMPA